MEGYLQTNSDTLTIIITSGASCPDSIVDGVIQRLLELSSASMSAEVALENFLKN
jgi:4-hydroxy-3-methylbut-2-enyl diphosphate reductase IspH